jgi:hypothetical protein
MSPDALAVRSSQTGFTVSFSIRRLFLAESPKKTKSKMRDKSVASSNPPCLAECQNSRLLLSEQLGFHLAE